MCDYGAADHLDGSHLMYNTRATEAGFTVTYTDLVTNVHHINHHDELSEALGDFHHALGVSEDVFLVWSA